MSLQTLDLDPLHLTYPTEQLRLSVISRAAFNFPSDVALHPLDWSKFLVSGKVWVGSPRVCRIDIRFSLDGRSLDSENLANILEPLGSRICDSKLWSQLSLSSSIEIPPPDPLNARQANISILLSQCPCTTTSTAYPRGWILDNIDVRAPPSIPSVQFQKLEVDLNFQSVQKNGPLISRGAKRCWEESDLMHPDQPPSVDTIYLKAFKEYADELANIIPTSMAEYFEQPEISPSEQRTILLSLAARSQLLQASTPVILSLPITESLTKATIVNDKHLLPRESKYKLQMWWDSHSTCPYPTSEEKVQLRKETGLQRKQWDTWFYSARRHLADPTKGRHNEDDMLLEDINVNQQASKKVMSCRNNGRSITNVGQIIPYLARGEPCDEDDILSLIDDEASFVASQSSTQSSISSNNSFMVQNPALATPSRDTTSIKLSLSSSSVLTSAALNILIGGSACKRSLQNITLKNAFPKTPLINLTPATFCPKFKQLMGHNSRFLPTISNAISSSWVRNCQGPGLRAKLLKLSRLAPLGSDHGHSTPSGGGESAKMISAVVQNRVWNMMQRKLSDPSMVGKLQWLTVDHGGVGEGEDPFGDEDLLGSYDIDGQNRMDNIVNNNMGGFIMDDYTGNEKLLLFDPMSDNEGLLSYFDDMEKVGVEMQTDEMLLGSEKYKSEDSEIMLIVDGNNAEIMLL